jgi:hypothetical protein
MKVDTATHVILACIAVNLAAIVIILAVKL